MKEGPVAVRSGAPDPSEGRGKAPCGPADARTLGRPDRLGRIAAGLLILFAFSAWNLTGPAHIALGGLTLILVFDRAAAWPRLRTDPVFRLALAAVALTGLLAWRAVLLFPETASLQWPAIWQWCAPFLFLVVAWWLRADLRLIHWTLTAAVVGLMIGVLRKSDWSLIEEILGGERYHFGQSALGIAFIASVVLIGLMLYYPSRRGLAAPAGRFRRLAVWLGWVIAVVFVAGMLVVLQARGAMLAMVVAGAVLIGYRLSQARLGRARGRARGVLLLASLLLALLTASVVWVSRDRLATDFAAFGAGEIGNETGWNASAAIRLNLWRTGLALFEARPWLGWGPGTSSTEFLVPEQVIAFPPATLANAPRFSHLHSVVAEILVRFGLVGVAIGLIWLVPMTIAARFLWERLAERDPRLRELLVLTTLMTGLFFLYDFRLVNVDLRFFMILYLGVLYTFWMHRGSSGVDPA